jgi:uncharacterized membrane protein
MTTTHHTRIGSPRTTYVGLWVLAAVGFTALLLLGQRLAAVGVFAAASVAAVAYQYAGDVRFDERDDAVVTAASARTVQAVGLASAIVFPALVAASALGYYQWTPFMAGVATTVAAVYLLWAGLLLVTRARG